MQAADLVRMLNQIAANQPAGADGAAATAEHVRLFWDPRMRADLAALLAAGGVGLSPVARAAAARLSAEAAPATD